MPRYRISRPRAAWDGEEIEYEPDPPPFTPALTVDIETETDTGIVDAHGYAIVRLPNAIGFQAEID